MDNFLQDKDFLKENDFLPIKQHWIKLTILNFQEESIEEVQGKVTGGSLTFDGNSAMRRTGTLSLTIEDYIESLDAVKGLFAINKKVKVQIGNTNITNKYTDQQILWFPMGVYVIFDPNISQTDNGSINVSLTLHDKMAFLNGECGGTLPATVDFSTLEDIGADGKPIEIRPTLYQIIQQLVHHFGGEQLGKIIISDLDTKIKRPVSWTGTEVYHGYKYQNGKKVHIYGNLDWVLNHGGIEPTLHKYTTGDEIGYILTDFTSPVELVGNAGDSVTTILDQIKNILGNYQYFYDVYGNFHFQEIKNYLNISHASTITGSEASYIPEINQVSVYTFDNTNIISSITNAPMYSQIKNDFFVWGSKKGTNDKVIPIRYHLAIDSKPQLQNIQYKVVLAESEQQGLIVRKPLIYPDIGSFPNPGSVSQFYCTNDNNAVYRWTNTTPAAPYEQDTSAKLVTFIPTDWRTQLFADGIEDEQMSVSKAVSYFSELKNEWPKIYDLENGQFFEQAISTPTSIDYFLDFIDTPSMDKFSIKNIGKRTTIISDDKINCIFEPDIPDCCFIDGFSDNVNEQVIEHQKRNFDYVTTKKTDFYPHLQPAGVFRSAFSEIQQQLWEYTHYMDSISLTVLPIYHLEPNTRISVINPSTDELEDYMINSFTISLDVAGTMTLNCSKVIQRI